MTNQETVTTFLDGFNDPSKIEASMNLLVNDYKFKNPMVELNSKAEFIGLAQKIGSVLTGLKIINTAENGDWVAVRYEFTSSLPNVEKNLATEWFRLKDGLIHESHLIYDASEWRKIYQQLEQGE
nr:nuclear transport factor 2 family protein [uncultured Allomuricauda sp.]